MSNFSTARVKAVHMRAAVASGLLVLAILTTMASNSHLSEHRSPVQPPHTTSNGRMIAADGPGDGRWADSANLLSSSEKPPIGLRLRIL
jgi:hypothetical protein